MESIFTHMNKARNHMLEGDESLDELKFMLKRLQGQE
jgi:hypothetical protein